jgi:hypothetical protein
MSATLVAAGWSVRWGTVSAVTGLVLVRFLVALDQTVVGLTLPKIVAELNGFERYAWATTAYLVASTSMIPQESKEDTNWRSNELMIKRTDIPLGKDVYCTNGLAGRSSHLILNPLNRRITHLVVRKRHFPHSDRVVPM